MTTRSEEPSHISPLPNQGQHAFHIQQLSLWHGLAIRKATRKGVVDSKKMLEYLRKDTPTQPLEGKKKHHIEIIRTFQELFSKIFSKTKKAERKQQESATSIQTLGRFILQAHKEAKTSDDRKILHNAMLAYHTLVETHEQVYGKKLQGTEGFTGVDDAKAEIAKISKGEDTDVSYFARQIQAAIQDGEKQLTGLKGEARTKARATLHHNILLLYNELLEFKSYKEMKNIHSHFEEHTSRLSNLFERLQSHPITANLTKEGSATTFTTAFCELLKDENTKQEKAGHLNSLCKDDRMTEAQKQLARYCVDLCATHHIDTVTFYTEAIDAVYNYTGDTESLEMVSADLQTDEIRKRKDALYAVEPGEKPECATESEWREYIQGVTATLTAKRADLKAAITRAPQDREREAEVTRLDAESKKSEAKGQLKEWLFSGMDRTSTESVKKATALVTQCDDHESLEEKLEQIRTRLPADHPIITKADTLFQELSSPHTLQGTPEQIAALFITTREELKKVIEEGFIAVDSFHQHLEVAEGKIAEPQAMRTEAHEKTTQEIHQLAQSIDEFTSFSDSTLQAEHQLLRQKILELQKKAQEASTEVVSQELTLLKQEYEKFCNDVKKFWSGQFHAWQEEYQTMAMRDRSFTDVAEGLFKGVTAVFGLSSTQVLPTPSAETNVSQKVGKSLETLRQLYQNPSSKISELHSAFLQVQQEYFSREKLKEETPAEPKRQRKEPSQRVLDTAEQGWRSGLQKLQGTLESRYTLPDSLRQVKEDLGQVATEATNALRQLFGPSRRT